MNIKEILKKSNEMLVEKNIDENFLKSRILLADVLEVSKEYLIIHEEEEVSKDLEKEFFEKIRKIFKWRTNSIYNK